MTATDIQITVDGTPVLTTAQAAERHDIEPASMRKAISRAKLEPLAHLDARTPLYDQAQLDALITARPGKGSNLRRGETSADQPR